MTLCPGTGKFGAGRVRVGVMLRETGLSPGEILV